MESKTMTTARDNLKRIAERAKDALLRAEGRYEFEDAATPETILALIAEFEQREQDAARIRDERDQLRFEFYQRERKVERLISAGEQLKEVSYYADVKDAEEAIDDFEDAVKALQKEVE